MKCFLLASFLFFCVSAFAGAPDEPLLLQLKRLESHQDVINWILSKKEAPAELQKLAKIYLARNNQLQRHLMLGHYKYQGQIDHMLMQWDKIEIPHLQKKYPLFFNEPEEALFSQMQEQLGPLMKTRQALPFEYLQERVWGFRPLELIKALVVHHTKNEDIEEIYKQHTAAARFAGDLAPFIAYHFLIDKNGTIYALNRLTDRVWHARGANNYSLGIALLGNLDEKPPPLAQYNSLIKLIRFLTVALKINPQTAIHGHGELTSEGNDTRCPGIYGKEMLKQIKYKLRNHSLLEISMNPGLLLPKISGS